MRNIKAVIFDMDGLMFDSERLWLNSAIRTNKEYGYQVPEELIINCIGCRNEEIKTELKKIMGKEFDADKYLKINEMFMNEDVKINGLKLKSGLIELLEFLKKRNISIAIASSSSTQRVIKCLFDGNIPIDYFDCIIGGENVMKPKPDPEIYLKTLRFLNISAEESIAIEDSDNGIKSAYMAGIKPILIPDIKKPKEETLRMAYKQYERLDQIIELFKKYN